MADEKKLEGLGGWLILVGIGIIASPLRLLSQIIPIYSDMFSKGYWDLLTTPGSSAYHALWAPILSLEIFINVALVITWIWVAILFFRKKRQFPTWYISTLIFTLAFIVLDAIAIKMVLPEETMFDAETTKEVLRSLVAVVIWVPYMLRSKRVHATFVR
ncbi:DUF2569 domain-containing protein [Methylobacillus gramineus]|uniref:DUF2569 domain-containing protein n=1 Tax=Methylobacillus gramineus TaxID=755169 RepID=UPI001CFFCBB3|nr:DUF2569 domain-containing protein [Methylobacillus gramineus]MCB5185550.1 DUF2569 domain-containing protein [Methylobacillus gramineus]